jgi:heme exporter protein A
MRYNWGYMAHAPFLYPGLDALENLLFWARAASLDHALGTCAKRLHIVGLSRHAHERTGVFFRGMAQRLESCRLLLADPKLILLDEPATGLTPIRGRMLLEQMLKAREQGCLLLYGSVTSSGRCPTRRPRSHSV